MAEGRLARRKGNGWIIALPAMVRRRLGVTEKTLLYWHLARRGEAVLAVKEQRTAGAPDTTTLVRDLAAAHARIGELRQRAESRDRAMYAEGYALGVAQAQERLLAPHGASAERARRRKMWRLLPPKAASPEASTVSPPAEAEAPGVETPAEAGPLSV